MLTLISQEPKEEPEQDFPYSHLDLSTPEKRERWKRATRMLLSALVEAEKNKKKPPDPAQTDDSYTNV
jgi:hypothetical protein